MDELWDAEFKTTVLNKLYKLQENMEKWLNTLTKVLNREMEYIF
jgi:hypothetical protein